MQPVTSTVSPPPVSQPEVLKPPTPRIKEGLSADLAIKLLVSILLAVAFVLAYKWARSAPIGIS